VTAVVDAYNFPPGIAENLWSFPLFGVAHVGAPPPAVTVPDSGPPNVDPVDLPPERQAEREARMRRREVRLAGLARSADLLDSGVADALLIVSRSEPLPLLKATLRFIAPSRPFAVFSIHKEPLVECYTYLKGRGVVGLTLTERWTQEYQVLPDRTHPHMMMHAAAGFVLSGTTTLKEHRPAAAAPTPKRSAELDDPASAAAAPSKPKRAKLDGDKPSSP